MGGSLATDSNDGYIPEFSDILKAIGLKKLDDGTNDVKIPARLFKYLISEIVRKTPFEEDYYAKTYPDVLRAFEAGNIPSLHEHFVTVGYFEGRQPALLHVNRDWYLSTYSDLARAYSRGLVKDLGEHLNKTGRYEGRSGSAKQAADRARWEVELKAIQVWTFERSE